MGKVSYPAMYYYFGNQFPDLLRPAPTLVSRFADIKFICDPSMPDGVVDFHHSDGRVERFTIEAEKEGDA